MAEMIDTRRIKIQWIGRARTVKVIPVAEYANKIEGRLCSLPSQFEQE